MSRRSPSPPRKRRNRWAAEDEDDEASGSKFRFPSPPPQAKADTAPVQRNFEASGALRRDAAPEVRGRKLKWAEPSDAAVADGRWRVYVFKGAARIGPGPLFLQGASAFLFGRDRSVADFALDHPSCSAQHAVVQFRRVGASVVRPYVIDLESTNGTTLNGESLRPNVFVELREKDVLRFAFSTREYVFLREDSCE